MKKCSGAGLPPEHFFENCARFLRRSYIHAGVAQRLDQSGQIARYFCNAVGLLLQLGRKRLHRTLLFRIRVEEDAEHFGDGGEFGLNGLRSRRVYRILILIRASRWCPGRWCGGRRSTRATSAAAALRSGASGTATSATAKA